MTADITPHLYKILTQEPPSPLPEALPTAPEDAKDGFIHLSAGGKSVARTADLLFASYEKLWLLELPLEPLAAGEGELKWEGGEGCVHLCGRSNIGAEEVSRVIAVERKGGQTWRDVMNTGLESA